MYIQAERLIWKAYLYRGRRNKDFSRSSGCCRTASGSRLYRMRCRVTRTCSSRTTLGDMKRKCGASVLRYLCRRCLIWTEIYRREERCASRDGIAEECAWNGYNLRSGVPLGGLAWQMFRGITSLV